MLPLAQLARENKKQLFHIRLHGHMMMEVCMLSAHQILITNWPRNCVDSWCDQLKLSGMVLQVHLYQLRLIESIEQLGKISFFKGMVG